MKTVVFEGIYETKEQQSRQYDWQEESDLPEVSVAYVKIDGKIFKFEEDPSDGYRSYCRESRVDKAPKGARFNFQDHPVLVCMAEIDGENVGDPDNKYSTFDLKDFRGIVIYSPRDKSTVLGCFGTDNIGDYYPGCRMYMDIVAINVHCIPNTEAGVLIYAPEE